MDSVNPNFLITIARDFFSTCKTNCRVYYEKGLSLVIVVIPDGSKINYARMIHKLRTANKVLDMLMEANKMAICFEFASEFTATPGHQTADLYCDR